MRNKTISLSSDSCSEDENMPLKMMKTNGFNEDPNSYHSLCRHSIEACEFCDRISTNRYSSLIHNVKHIIIPLLNQNILECPTCLHHFTSQEDLTAHRLKKHPDLSSLAKIPLVKIEKAFITQRTPLQATKCQTEENGDLTIVPVDKPIKKRLLFEDDDDDVIYLGSNQLLNDLTTDCKVKLEVFDTPWLNDEFSAKSVHYDELLKPGVYRCKRCGKGFPVRYDAIIHEATHITFKDSQLNICVICKKYILGDKNVLRHHYLTYHTDSDLKQANIRSIETLNKRIIFEDINEEKKQFDAKILMLCELCFSFCKNKASMNYECLKTVNKLGQRFNCDKCGLPFFEIKIVRRYMQRAAFRTFKKKKKTNEDRLKTIANRFKMMKKH